MTRKNTIRTALLVICGLLTVSGPALAGPDQFICAAAEAIACAQDVACTRGSPDRVNLPLLWRVDVAGKAFMSIMDGGQQRNSTILEVIDRENALILYGADGEMAWSVIIDKSDGEMTLSSATRDVGYIVHGACSTKIMK